MDKFEQIRKTVNSLEAQAKRENEGMFADKNIPKMIVSNPEIRYELGQSAYSSGTTITFIKSLKGNDIKALEDDYIKLNKFCKEQNKEDK